MSIANDARLAASRLAFQFGAQYSVRLSKNTYRAQVFRVELDRIARKHFRVAIVRMRTAAKRRFAKLSAELAPAIIGM